MLGGSGGPPMLGGSGKGGKGKGGKGGELGGSGSGKGGGKGGGKEGGKGGGSQESGGMGPGGSGGKGKGGKGGGKGGDPLPPLNGGLAWGAFGGPQFGEDFSGNGAILARSPKKNSRHMHDDCEEDYVIECDDDCLYRY